MNWADVFDRVRAKWPTVGLADLAAATVPQVGHLLGETKSGDGDRQAALYGLLDDLAARLRLSPAGLAGMPVADVARQASTLAGEDVPEWSLRYGLVKWVAASAALAQMQ